MTTFDVIFYLFALVTLGGACVVVFSRHIIYAAFGLLFTFFGVACLYLLLHADFLAVTQLLVYVGGILVLLLFGVMLTSRIMAVDMKTGTVHPIPALILTAVLGGTLSGLLYSTFRGVASPVSGPESTTKMLGEMLMTTYVLPFEIASIVLIVAMIGAALTARRARKV